MLYDIVFCNVKESVVIIIVTLNDLGIDVTM